MATKRGKRIMAGIIAKQPNGLYCRVSTVVNAPTNWNMTKQDYIDLCVEKAVERAKREAEDVIANYCYDFNYALSYIFHGEDTNMTDNEYEQFINECNTEAEV